MQPSVLIVEDEEGVRTALAKRLRLQGYVADMAATGEEALKRLGEGGTDLVLLDYRLPDIDGLELLERIRRLWPDVVVIVMTGHAVTTEVSVRAMRLGAHHYVSKPFSLDEMMVNVEKALEAKRLRAEVQRLRTTQLREYGLESIIARSPKMLEIIGVLKHLADSEARTILLQGESGTGKDLVAKVIHYHSPRAGRPFMNITCTALPETLLESELFGHEKGAFTDARQQKQGLVELADGGTVFLDEIGDMPAALQAKLLRFLEEKAFRRVGGTKDLRVDVRVIAATNRDLREQVKKGAFREDLFYRLNVFPVTLPPLRERREDIPLLAEHFVRQYNREFHKEIEGLETAALEAMTAYDWPGNVRELRNVVERAMLLAAGPRLKLADLPAELKVPVPPPGVSEAGPERATRPGPPSSAASAVLARAAAAIEFGPEGIDIHEVERLLVRKALEYTRGNQSRAAALLHLSRDQFRYRLEKYGLKPREEPRQR